MKLGLQITPIKMAREAGGEFAKLFVADHACDKCPSVAVFYDMKMERLPPEGPPDAQGLYWPKVKVHSSHWLCNVHHKEICESMNVTPEGKPKVKEKILPPKGGSGTAPPQKVIEIR